MENTLLLMLLLITSLTTAMMYQQHLLLMKRLKLHQVLWQTRVIVSFTWVLI